MSSSPPAVRVQKKKSRLNLGSICLHTANASASSFRLSAWFSVAGTTTRRSVVPYSMSTTVRARSIEKETVGGSGLGKDDSSHSKR